MDTSWKIDKDIHKASTPPAEVYHKDEWFDLAKTEIFAKGWHYIGSEEEMPPPGHGMEFTIFPGALNESIAIVRDKDGTLRAMSNVCTHRGNLILLNKTPEPVVALRCGYHGRKFDLQGCFKSMPCFDGVEDYPRKDRDDLKTFPIKQFGPLYFVQIKSDNRLADPFNDILDRVGHLPIDQLKFDPSSSIDFNVKANWALYVENYLEGFHIPFVHAGLNEAIDFSTYKTDIHDFCNLQITEGEGPAFDLPAGHQDEGKGIAAYYYWVFPTLMFNVYPWGLSFNSVEPVGPTQTTVKFRSFIWDESKRGQGAGGDLITVEHEDEEIVEQVQLGVKSQVYTRGRYSPTMEKGTHHFHRLLEHFLLGSQL